MDITKATILKIKIALKEFIKNPYFYQSECDIQSRLYSKIISIPYFNKKRRAFVDHFGSNYRYRLYHYSNIVHTECSPMEENARVDLVILKPSKLDKYYIEPLVAIEISKDISLNPNYVNPSDKRKKKVNKIKIDYLKLKRLRKISKFILIFNCFAEKYQSFSNPQMRKVLKTRYKKIKSIKRYLNNKDICCVFIDIYYLKGKKGPIRHFYIDEFGKKQYFKKLHKDTLYKFDK